MYYDMGKGVMLKGKGGENIYPVTASDLVYDPITKKNVKEELGGKVEEAPSDGKQYGRINGTWAEVEAGAVSETALISLTPNDGGLNGVSVKVTTNEGETLLDEVWQGAQLSVQVRAGLTYTVTVGDKEGYIKPEAVSYVAVKGATRTINMAYVESKLTVEILSNQGEDSAISGVKAIVKYGSTTMQVANGGSVALPLNANVTITFPSVEGYKTPDAITYTHTSGAYVKSGTYKTELVNVTLSADNGQSVSGQKVTINGTQHTWDGNVISQKVPFGATYEVSVDDKSGYTKPSAQSFTASQVTREVGMVYVEIKQGVFLCDVYNNLYTKEEWTGGKIFNAVAVITDKCAILIDGYKYDERQIFERFKKVTSLPKLSENDALNDYKGFENTQILLSEENGATSAPRAAGYYKALKNGVQTYLGACGEMNAIFSNLDEINSFLSHALQPTIIIDTIWSSTHTTHWADEDVDNAFMYYDDVMGWMGENSNNYFNVFPIAKYEKKKLIKFYIDGEEYQCLEGTIWRYWAQSYFRNVYNVNWDSKTIYNGAKSIQGITIDDIINENANYTTA